MSRDHHTLEGAAGQDRAIHEGLLSQGQRRFPEESYQLLLRVGASPEEALGLLGYDTRR
jgi:hypothetical protein